MRTVVWGSHLTTVTAASAWLQKVGLNVIGLEGPQKRVTELQTNPSDPTIEEAQLLHAAKGVDADYLVLVDTIITPTMVLRRVDREPSQEGDGTETVTIQKLTVAVRGVNVETKKVDWSGLASYPEAISEIDQKLRTLTWDALGVAWGVQSTYTPADLRDLKSYQLMNPAIDKQTFPR